MDFAADLPVFLSDFAVPATLDGQAVTGIFDSEYMQAFDGMAASATVYRLASTAAASATSSSVLVVGAASYRVRSVQPNGTGITELMLERQ